MTEQFPSKKKRIRRSPEKVASLVLEAERVGAASVCRREGIAPAQLSRWKEKFLTAGVAGLRDMKREWPGSQESTIRSRIGAPQGSPGRDQQRERTAIRKTLNLV